MSIYKRFNQQKTQILKRVNWIEILLAIKKKYTKYESDHIKFLSDEFNSKINNFLIGH